MTSTVMATALIVFSLFVFLGETGSGEEEGMAFAQTTPYTITNNVIVGDVSRAHINFGNVFGSAISLNEIFEGTARADTGITIASLTFTGGSTDPQVSLDCDGKIYITTEPSGITDTNVPIAIIIDNPGTSSFSSGDTLNLRITVNTSQNPKVTTPAFCPIPATPTNPMAVSSVTEGVGGFDELDGAFGISTIQIGSATYAIVTGNVDSGIQIINVSNPAVPTAISSVADGGTDSAGNTFDTLSRSVDVATVEINSRTYALATSGPDDGIQIIDITTPASPTVASSVTDGSTFDELDGATSVTTVKIGSATYALVASGNDDGVQIINITDPTNPTATSSVTDGAGGFNTLDGARGVTTIQIGSATYALVASNLDDGVQIINITNPATPTVTASITDGAGGFDRLDGATDIATVTIGQSIYALVTANVDNAVQIIDITNPATPTPVSAVFDGLSDGTNTFDRLDEATNITTIKVGSSTYALVASAADNGVQIINITNPARPTAASSISDNSVDGDGNTFTTLAGARDVATIRIGSEIYALVTAGTDDGVQIIRVASQADSDPAPKPAPNLGSASIESPLVASFLTDNVGGFTTLSTPGGLTTVKIGSNTYALVTSLQDNSGGVQIIDITRPTAPILASEITVENSGANLDGANSITTIKIGSDTYALVASVFGNAVQILNISDPTAPTAVFTINDGGTFNTLRGASDITTVKMGPSTYALVTANVDHGVQIIDVSDPTAPTAVTSITDGSTFDTLREATSITTVEIGSDTYALVASRGDNGVQIINITDIANPTAVSSITSNQNGFGTLSVGEDTITTIKIGSVVYAILTSSPGDHAQIINITNPANPTFVSIINHNDMDSDGGTFGIFDGPTDVTTVTIAGTTYAIVVANEDNGIQIIDMSDPTMPTAVSSVAQGGVDDNGVTFNRLNGPLTITTVQIGTSLYALVASNQGSAGVQIIRIADDIPDPTLIATPENPIPVSSIAVNTDLPFQSANAVTTVKIGSSTYALVASFGGDVSIISGVQIIDITDPASLTSVSSITDATTTNGSPFDALEGANSITTVTIGRSTYALVASIDDVNGIQIIDISNPANPTAVISIADDTTDGSGGTFDTLARPFDITTVKIGSVTYALVADGRGDGVQIIDISNPAAPTAVSSVIDATASNGSTFDTLDGAENVTTVTIGSDVYALVTASGESDDGVQIINITNPAAPTAVSSVINGDTDGAGGTFDQLVNAAGISTITIGSSTYALIAASSGIQIINITDPANPLAVTSISDGDRDNNNSMFIFDEANSITTVTIGSSTYALVASSFRDNDNVQIINITDIANPLLVSLLVDDDTLSLVEPQDITTVQIGSSIYAVIATDVGARTQIIRISEDQPVPEPEPEPVTTPENPMYVSSISDGDDDSAGGTFDTLDGSASITTIKMGSSTYALVTAFRDDGIQIIDTTDPTNLITVSSVSDDDTDGDGGTFDTLGGATGITTIKMGSSTYALVTAFSDDGVQIIDITDPANLIAVSSVSDGVTFDTLNGANGITTVQIGSSTYALVAASDDNGIQIINISDPAAPTAVTSVTNGGTFDTLGGATGITTVTIGSDTYALVASAADDGIQIINITNPGTPTAVSSVTDGGTFDELDGATGITTVTIGSSTYALVASRDDDGIQIINISNPAAPTAVSSVTEGNTFDELDGVFGITTVKIGSSVYALGASNIDDGVQIIDITNPAAPTAASSVFDGSAFDELDGATGITTVQIGSSIYALVASFTDDGVQIIRIAVDQLEPGPVATPENPIAVSSVTDGIDGFVELDDARNVTTVQIGSSVYALVTSFTDAGIQIIDITNPATPTAVSSASDATTSISSAFDELDGANGITTVKIGQSTYALVASFNDSGVQIIDITNPATPTAVSSIANNGADDDGNTFEELDRPFGIATVKIDSSVYALVAASGDDGIQIIDITNPATPTVVSSIADGASDGSGGTFDELDGASDISIVQIGQSTYAIVASFSDNGVQIIDITNPATPIAVSSVTDGATFDELGGAYDITTVKIGSSVYALVASFSDNGVQIINITNPATPTAASSITDDATFDALAGASNITTVRIDSSVYALVTSFNDDGVQIIDITNPATPIAVSSITDGDTFDELDGAIGITTVRIGSSVYALVASSDDDGVQIIRIADDQPEPAPASPENPIAASSITDDSSFALGGVFDIATVRIGPSTYALTASSSDNAVQIINITDPANPLAISSVSDGDTDGNGDTFDTLIGANAITTVKIGSATYALVTAFTDNSIQIIDITDPSALIAVSSVTDGGSDGNGDTFDELQGASSITTVRIGSATYALVASTTDSGIQIIDITTPAAPTVTSSITDGVGGFGELNGATGITTVQIGESTYALVASFDDDGVQIINITNPASPTATSSIADGSNSFDTLDGPRGITTVQIGSDTYALVASTIEGVQIINITDPATPAAVISLADDDADANGNIFDELGNATGITTIKIGSSTYALVASRSDDGVQIINITNPAAPTIASSISDGGSDAVGGIFDELEGASDITTFQIGSSIYALVASLDDNGVQIIRIFEDSPKPESNSRPTSSGGSSSDWKKKPTFGKSWEVSSDQLVKNGFSFNGYSLDITDNWHTDFVKTSTIIGEINHVTMRVFAFDGLRYVQLSLGLPEIGATSDAEADIIINLERNYDNPNDYDIVGIVHEQTEPLVNTQSTTASITPSLCNTSHTEPFCYDIDIEFAVDAPLSHDVIAISAIDTKRRTTTTHINDGVEFLGESLLPAETASIFIKKTNQDKGNHIILTQDDRRYNTWTDQDGYQWMQNSYGTWIQQTLPDMIISHDGSTQVMTRLHSEFDSMVQQEQERAILIFDSKDIQSVPGEPFSYEFHEIIPRHLDEGLLEKMELEEILALEKMLNIYIYDDSWSEIDDDDNE